MDRFPFSAARFALGCAAAAALAGCQTDMASRAIVDRLTPYRVEIIQGNLITKEQVDLLRPGLTRQQVREVLGTPLVADPFHLDRWDYVFTIRRRGIEPQVRRLSVFFNGQALQKFEGDPMPPESEFVASLDSRRKGAPIPPLEASEEKLKQYAPATPRPPAPAAPATPPPTNYPPLETR